MKIIENHPFKKKGNNENDRPGCQLLNHCEIYGYVERAFIGYTKETIFGSTELEAGGIDGGTETPPKEVKTY